MVWACAAIWPHSSPDIRRVKVRIALYAPSALGAILRPCPLHPAGMRTSSVATQCCAAGMPAIVEAVRSDATLSMGRQRAAGRLLSGLREQGTNHHGILLRLAAVRLPAGSGRR